MNVATFFVVDENLNKCTYAIRVVIHDMYSGGFQDITKETYDNLVTATIQNIANGVNMPSIDFLQGNIVIDLYEQRGKPNALFQFYNVVLGSCIPSVFGVEQSVIIDKVTVDKHVGKCTKSTIKTGEIATGWAGKLNEVMFT